MTHRHFGIPQMTARSITGAGQPTARHHAPPNEARCNPFELQPSAALADAASPVDWSRAEEMTSHSSLAAYPSFPRSPFTQALIDVAAVIFAFLFVSVTALAIVGAAFILLFVRL